MLDMTLSVAGLYDYDNRLFDQLALPEGYDRDDVVSNILMECAELEVVYPSWDAMRAAIGMWSRSMLWTWKKRYEVSQVEYAPLENLKRETIQTEDTSGTSDGSSTHKIDGTSSDTTERDLTRGVDNQSHATSTGDSSNTNWRNGFNDGQTDSDGSDGEASTSGDTTGSEDTTENETITRNGTTGETGENTTTGKTTGSRNFTETTHGSIGVITSQTMFEQEWEVAKHNLVWDVVCDFKRRFCILVY